jgi:sarcosine oxidase
MRVAVVGCGAMGSAAGWRLAGRGADVVCYDRFSPPHNQGSSHGETRITRTAYAEGPWYVPLLQETFPMWRALEESTGSQLLTMTGLLTFGAPNSKWVVGVLESAREHGLETSVLDAAEARRRYPGHAVADGDVAVLDPQAGVLRPEAAIEAMARGLDVRRNVVVTRIDSQPGGVDVVTAQGSDRFDAAVVAAGPWVRELVPWLPVILRRQVQVWLAIQSGVDWFAAERFPVWMHESTVDGDVYGFPTQDGNSIKLARHHVDDDTGGDTVPRLVTDADLDPLRLYVTRYLRGVTRHVVRAIECTYTNTPDQHFAIGPHPDDPRIVIVSACSGHGFKFAPVIGDIAADLVLEGGTRRDITRFSLARFDRSVA